MEKKCYHAIRGMVFRNFLRHNLFLRRTPTGQKRRFSVFLAHLGPLALREIPGPGKRENTISRCQQHFLGGKPGRPKNSFSKFRNLFTFCAGRSPTGRKSRNAGFIVHFSLGQPSGRKTEKCNLPVPGALLGGTCGHPTDFSSKFRIFFTFRVSADRTATGGK